MAPLVFWLVPLSGLELVPRLVVPLVTIGFTSYINIKIHCF